MTTPRPKRSARKRVPRKRNDGDAPKRTPRRPAEQPRSMLDFQRMFPNEAACADYMERVRWPDGFVCPSCGTKGEPYRFAAHPAILECRACKKETSLTAGTVMHKTKQPHRTPSPGPRDGCPCEFCEVSRIVLAMVRDRVPPGFVWDIAPARNPSDETRAFVVRWGDA